MNVMYIVGNLTNDVEVKKTQSGKSVCRFSVAVNEYSKDGKSKATYIDCQAWEKTADVIGSFCSKGSKVLIEGKWNSSTYEVNGQKKKDVVCLVNKVEFLNTKDVNETNAPTITREETFSSTPKMSFEEENLPFF